MVFRNLIIDLFTIKQRKLLSFWSWLPNVLTFRIAISSHVLTPTDKCMKRKITNTEDSNGDSDVEEDTDYVHYELHRNFTRPENTQDPGTAPPPVRAEQDSVEGAWQKDEQEDVRWSVFRSWTWEAQTCSHECRVNPREDKKVKTKWNFKKCVVKFTMKVKPLKNSLRRFDS